MDGLIVVDKPVGPSSHDVVARVRRALGERRIGHTGTLDPMASGVLPLVIGRATRLSRFLTASAKAYEAAILLGSSTTTYDAAGSPVGDAYNGPWPARVAIDLALDAFRGTFEQAPPAYSAKKVAGRRSYERARAAERAESGGAPPAPASVQVTTHEIALLEVDGPRVALRVTCSAGFYVRSLAHDLGRHLGTGAHLAELRRTRSGDATLADAVALDDLERRIWKPAPGVGGFTPLERLLPGMAAMHLTLEGVRHAVAGRDIQPTDVVSPPALAALEASIRAVRLLNADGSSLVGIAERGAGSGLLHPSVILM